MREREQSNDVVMYMAGIAAILLSSTLWLRESRMINHAEPNNLTMYIAVISAVLLSAPILLHKRHVYLSRKKYLSMKDKPLVIETLNSKKRTSKYNIIQS